MGCIESSTLWVFFVSFLVRCVCVCVWVHASQFTSLRGNRKHIHFSCILLQTITILRANCKGVYIPNDAWVFVLVFSVPELVQFICQFSANVSQSCAHISRNIIDNEEAGSVFSSLFTLPDFVLFFLVRNHFAVFRYEINASFVQIRCYWHITI